jgi:molecular chaperone HscC
VEVKVFQGDNRRVENNLLLSNFSVTGIPKGPPGQAIEVRFTYDLNGVLEVEATIEETRRKATHVITRHARGLSAEQIAMAVDQMQAMKTSPRDETQNRYLLRRADRVYQELSVREQGELGRLLHGFEEALESGEKEIIERFYEVVKEFLDMHEATEDDF